MNSRYTTLISWIGSGVLFATGIAISAWTAAGLGPASKLMELQNLNLAELRAMERNISRCDAAVAAFDRLKVRYPEPLATLIKRELPDYEPASAGKTTDNLDRGWELITRDVVFAEIPMAEAFQFIKAAESVSDPVTRPPWRLTAISIRSAPGKEGLANVTLQLQSLRQTGSADD